MNDYTNPEAFLAAEAVEVPLDVPGGAIAVRGAAVMIRVADVAPVPVRWLWPSRIALGKLTVLAGHPGLGKSQLTAFLDAIAGEGTTRRTFNLAQDVTALAEAIDALGDVRLVVIDPVTAYLGGTASHRTADVRGLLAPLSALAAERGVAVLLVSHLTKGTGEAMSRVTGSMGFVAAARAALVVSKDAEDGDRRLVVPLKNNLGNDRTGLAYRIEERAIGAGLRAPALAWEAEPVTITAEEALAPPSTGDDDEEGGALAEAKEVLRDFLAGGPRTAPDAFKAARGAGVSERTLKRAKKALGVETMKAGFGAGWEWHLPTPKGANEPEGDQA